MINKEDYGKILDSKEDQILIYLDEGLRNFAAAGLWTFAAETYHYSYLKENLNLYIDFIHMPFEEKKKWVLPLAMNNLTTNFTICAIFENYMKGRLLFANNVVHLFKDNKKRKQQAEFRIVYQEGSITEEGLRRDLMPDRTIGLGVLLTEHYANFMKLHENILYLLNHIKEPRNKLHFYHSIHYTTNEKIVEGLIAMDKFVKGYLTDQLKRMNGQS